MSKRWQGTLAILSEKHKAGVTIWWRRPSFYEADYRDIEPKWHIFENRLQVKDDKYSFGWIAKCGYTHVFNEYMFEQFPQVKSSKAPKVADRCKRCVKEQGKANEK